jgi:hypothetical protein
MRTDERLVIALAALFLVAGLFTSPAVAANHRHHHRHHAPAHRGRVQLATPAATGFFWFTPFPAQPPERIAFGGLSAPCREARREGGPCGCNTGERLLNTSAHIYHGINIWLADGWLAFRRTAAAPGMAAIWPHRHVAPIVAVNGDGTITVADYFGEHRVRMAGLVFVDPRSR